MRTVIFFLPIYFMVRKQKRVKYVSKVTDLVSGRVRTIFQNISLWVEYLFIMACGLQVEMVCELVRLGIRALCTSNTCSTKGTLSTGSWLNVPRQLCASPSTTREHAHLLRLASALSPGFHSSSPSVPFILCWSLASQWQRMKRYFTMQFPKRFTYTRTHLIPTTSPQGR